MLNHLGINLYSNIPAVLSEVVANAWDADAELVDVKIDKSKKTITITDDGHGMNTSEINAEVSDGRLQTTRGWSGDHLKTQPKGNGEKRNR